MKRISSVTAWFMWFIAALFFALDYFQHTAPSVLIEPMANTLHLNVFSIGNIMSVYFPVYAISQIPAGYLLDRLGPRLALPLGAIIITSGILITAGANGYSSILIGRILVAVGSAFAFIGALKVASVWLDAKAFPIAVGLTNTIGVLGGIFGQFLLNWIIGLYSWQKALLIIGGAGIIIAILLLLFLRRPVGLVNCDKLSDRIKLKDLRVFKSLQLWFLALYAGIMVGTVVVAFGELYAVLFLHYYYGVSSQVAASISSMILIGIAVGGPTHGIIAAFFKDKKTWMLVGNISTLCLFFITIMFASFLNSYLLYVIYFLLGFFVSSMLLAFSVGKEIFPRSLHGITIAFINMMIGISGAVFQPLAGEILKITNSGVSHTVVNPDTFIFSFYFLLIPLVFSLVFCLLVKTQCR